MAKIKKYLATKEDVQTSVDGAVETFNAVTQGIYDTMIDRIQIGTDTIHNNGNGDPTADVTEALKKLIAAETSNLGLNVVVVDNVSSLPTDGATQTIYLVPNSGTDKNTHDEYIWIQSTGKYELIGSTSVELTNYFTKEEVYNTITSETESLTQRIENVELMASSAITPAASNWAYSKIGKDKDGLYIEWTEV